MKKTHSILAAFFCSLLLILSMTACRSSNTSKPGNDTADWTAGQAVDADSGQNGDIMILFTSDVHCGVRDGFGFAGLQQIRDSLTARGYQVLLIDDGDFIQGGVLGTVTEGEAIINLMNEMKYDVVIPGNHEFDYGMDRFLELADKAEFPLISCNFNKEGKLVFAPYLIKEVNGIKIAFVGVTTPDSLTTSFPEHFQNDKGEYIYGFMEDKTGQKVYDAVQKAVDDARKDGADYVYVMGHMGNSSESKPWTYADVISHTNGIDVFLDGHSHDTDQVVMKNKDGEEVVRSACGTKMNCIGYSHISPEQGIEETSIWTWENKESAPSLFAFDNDIEKAIEKEAKDVDRKLSVLIGETAFDLTVKDPEVEYTDGKPVRMVRRAETNMGDFIADAYRDQSGADIALINGGSVRTDFPAGPITYGSVLELQPFENTLCVVEASGQQILDALEWGCRSVPFESGAFLQVSGLTYEIDSRIDSGCIEDEKSMCVGIKGKRRVRNVKVGSEALDPEKTYTVAGTNYILLADGDGHTAFRNSKITVKDKKLDIQVVIDFIAGMPDSRVDDDRYADPYGQGRIVIIE